MLFFPADLNPDYVTNQEVPDYAVNTFTSDSGLEWRNLQSCTPTGAKVKLSWEKTTVDTCNTGSCYPMPPGQEPDPIACAVWSWWKTTRGTFRAFEIPEDHLLWDRMVGIDDCFKDLFEPFNRWRFAKKPQVVTDQCGIYDVSMELIQIPQCFTYQ